MLYPQLQYFNHLEMTEVPSGMSTTHTNLRPSRDENSMPYADLYSSKSKSVQTVFSLELLYVFHAASWFTSRIGKAGQCKSS